MEPNASWAAYEAGEVARAEEKKRLEAGLTRENAMTTAESHRPTHPTASLPQEEQPSAAAFSSDARDAPAAAYSGGPTTARNQRRAAHPPPSPFQQSRSSKPVDGSGVGVSVARPSSARLRASPPPRRHSEQKRADAHPAEDSTPQGCESPSTVRAQSDGLSDPSAPATLDAPTRGSDYDVSEGAAATGDSGPASSCAPSTARRGRPSRPSPPRSPRSKMAQQAENAKRLLDKAKAHEHASKARVAWLRRYAHEAKRQAATEAAAKKKAALAAALRAEKLRLLGIHGGPLARTAPASDEEVAALSTLLNRAMHRVFPPPATPSWAKLFCEADEDQSGLLSYNDFAQLVRARLGLPPSGACAVPDRLLRATWRALDEGSGLLKAGEFGCFMRRGELHPRPDARSPRERVVSQKSKGAKELRAFKDKLWERSKSGHAAASAEEVRVLSRALNRRLLQLYPPPATPSWYKLYKLTDEDGSGQISYSEFTALVRTPQGLGVPEEHTSSLMLARVWAAINTDACGLVTAGEFGAFMRRGEDALLIREVGRLEQKELQARLDHDAESARRKLRQASAAMHQRARLLDVEAYNLAAEIVRAKGPGWRPGGEAGLPAPPATAGPSPGRRPATARKASSVAAQPARTQSARWRPERRVNPPPLSPRLAEGLLVSSGAATARKSAARVEELDELRAWCVAEELEKQARDATAAPWPSKSSPRDQHAAPPRPRRRARSCREAPYESSELAQMRRRTVGAAGA